jgi:hypothetical protein
MKSKTRPIRVVVDVNEHEKARLDRLAKQLEVTRQLAVRQLVREAATRHGVEELVEDAKASAPAAGGNR